MDSRAPIVATITAIVLAVACSSSDREALQVDRPVGRTVVFVEQGIEWEEGPPGLSYQVAFGTLTILAENGRLVQLSCRLIRDAEDGPLMIDLKSGFWIAAGTWEARLGLSVAVRRRVVVREKLVRVVGASDKLPGPWSSEDWTLSEGGAVFDVQALRTPSGTLVRAPELEDPEFLRRLIQPYLGRE